MSMVGYEMVDWGTDFSAFFPIARTGDSVFEPCANLSEHTDTANILRSQAREYNWRITTKTREYQDGVLGVRIWILDHCID